MKLYMGIVIASACLVATIAGEGFIGGRFLDPPVPSKCPNSKFFFFFVILKLQKHQLRKFYSHDITVGSTEFLSIFNMNI